MGFSTGLSCRALGLRESISGRHKVSVRLFGRFRASDIIKRESYPTGLLTGLHKSFLDCALFNKFSWVCSRIVEFSKGLAL